MTRIAKVTAKETAASMAIRAIELESVFILERSDGVLFTKHYNFAYHDDSFTHLFIA